MNKWRVLNEKNNGILESKISNKKSLKIREDRVSKFLDKVYESIINYEDCSVNGVLSISNFEKDDRFFIPSSSYNKFPKKRPSTNSYTFKAFVLNGNDEIPILITVSLPWDENLQSMNKTWNDITSYMLLVQEVFVDTF